jgi:hypothetical protein
MHFVHFPLPFDEHDIQRMAFGDNIHHQQNCEADAYMRQHYELTKEEVRLEGLEKVHTV